VLEAVVAVTAAQQVAIVVASITAAPAGASLGVSEFPPRPQMAGGGSSQQPSADSTPSAAADATTVDPHLVLPTTPPPEGFAAALLSQRLIQQTPNLQEIRLRTPTGWRAPSSPLRLTDRRV